MFLDDAYVIDSYNRKVLKVSNDISTELFNLEKEDIVTENKDFVSIDDYTKNLIKKYLKISDTEIEKIVNRKDNTTKKKERSGYSSILVSQDKVSLFITNRITNHLYHYKKDAISGEFSLFQKIRVGKKPVACCEDPNGNIYVANYGDNTVSKVEVPTFKSKLLGNEEAQDKVVKTMVVSAGPRSIVSDEEGTIWVACYLSHKIDPINDTEIGGIVNKIVNATVVDQIVVGNNPSSITCDINNTIWVANAGSNTVSRIVKSKRIVDFEVGPRPMAIVNDSFGNVYVTNYEGNSVTMIETSSKAIAAGDNITTIPVGEGPNAIDINSKDEILVVCGLDNTIYKINNKKVISTIKVCDSPVAIGDFTGCSTYNKLNIMAKDEESDKKDKELNDIIEKAKTTSEEIEDLKSKVAINTENIESLKNNTSLKTEFDEFKNTVNTNIETINTSKASKEDLDTFKSETNTKIEEAKANAISPEDRNRIGYIDTLKENMMSKEDLANLKKRIDIEDNFGTLFITVIDIEFKEEIDGAIYKAYYLIDFSIHYDYNNPKLPKDFEDIPQSSEHNPITFEKDGKKLTVNYNEESSYYRLKIIASDSTIDNFVKDDFPFNCEKVKISCKYRVKNEYDSNGNNLWKPIYGYNNIDSIKNIRDRLYYRDHTFRYGIGMDTYLKDTSTLDYITYNGKIYPNIFYNYTGNDYDESKKSNHTVLSGYNEMFYTTYSSNMREVSIDYIYNKYSSKEIEYNYGYQIINTAFNNYFLTKTNLTTDNREYQSYLFIILDDSKLNDNRLLSDLRETSYGGGVANYNKLRVKFDDKTYYFDYYPKELGGDKLLDKDKNALIYYCKLNMDELPVISDLDHNHTTIVKIFLK